MLQVDRILCPISPTAAAHPALAQAFFLAAPFRATLHIVPLLPDAGGTTAGSTSQTSTSSSDEATRSALRDIAAAHAQRLHPAPSFVVPSLDVPTLATLLRYADDEDIGLIVLDTPEDRGPIPALASRPARQIVEEAKAPVFVVEHAADPSTFRRLLVPIDFSEHARGALTHAKELAYLLGASLDVLHVMERPQYVALSPTDMLSLADATLSERKARRRVTTFLAGANSVDVPMRAHVIHGDAADQIVYFVREHTIDLVVISTHGVIGQPEHPLGNVADKVLRRVARPVFLTRAFGRSLISSPPSSEGPTAGTPSLQGDASGSNASEQNASGRDDGPV